MATKKNSSIVKSKRDFVGGLLIGAGAVSVASPIRSLLERGNKDKAELISSDYSQVVSLFPVTRVNDVYNLFLVVTRLVAPSLVSGEDFVDVHRQLWERYLELDFFLYANDFVLNIREVSGDKESILPKSPEIGAEALLNSMRRYSREWAKLIEALLTFSPELTKSYMLRSTR